ncbi:hypothetical protein [Bifidobacterium phasiani]|uniref:Uncharacterized protein n=1 Tax=Bifidobacterium phasiani TaxID=2834431 RepID=A0ABS6WAR8_9BIFI|nr:hypothetical protein [Bifidobacterium phasiani]MBW3083502.1 hypothetical protein [Bifidobacterium phasiani]
MTFELDDALIGRIAALPAVREAAVAAAGLIALWPLTDAARMDNDAKYAENLQVRITRTMAALMTGEDVTVPDAEYVYEGADEIPGRPQRIVDALLTANDTYDAMADYSETGDVRLVLDAMDALEVHADETTLAGVRAVLDAVGARIAPQAVDEGRVPPSDDADEIARRFALVIVAGDALVALLCDGGDAAARTLPVLLYANELGERLSVPRVCMGVGDVRAMLDARASAEDPAVAFAAALAPLAAAEWARHRDDVLWDPVEAKKRAKEEDERKNKEALAAKFAHVKDDPNKETVEL